MDRIYSLGEVARLLSVQAYKIAYAISTGAVPDAERRLANKRCFTIEDVRRLARHFGAETSALTTGDGGEGGKCSSNTSS